MQWIGSVVAILFGAIIGWGAAQLAYVADASQQGKTGASMEGSIDQAIALFQPAPPPSIDTPEGLRKLLGDVAHCSPQVSLALLEVGPPPAEIPEMGALADDPTIASMLEINGGWRYTSKGWEHVSQWYQPQIYDFRKPSFHPLLFAALQVLVVLVLMLVYSSSKRRKSGFSA